MKPFDYIKQITVCCFVILLCVGCSKSDIELSADNLLPSSQTAQRVSLTDTLSNDTCCHTKTWACGGCIPNITVRLWTGVPMVALSMTSMNPVCKEYKISMTLNGETKTNYISTDYQLEVPMDFRVSWGQSCSGSVTVSCKNPDCENSPSPCKKTAYFTFNGNGDGGSADKPTCGKDLSIVSVAVPQRGRFLVDIPATPSGSGYMNPDTYIIYYSDGEGNYERQRGGLSGDTVNEINFYASGGGSYWIKMYNAAICGGSDSHYLYYYMNVSPNFWSAQLVKNH